MTLLKKAVVKMNSILKFTSGVLLVSLFSCNSDDRLLSGDTAILLEYDKTQAKYYIDILLAETVPSNIPLDTLTLKIDKDLTI